MREYIIVTDSCADLSAAEVQDLGVAVIPLRYEMDGEEYLNYPDHSELDPAEFFARVSAGAACKTSAISVGAFVDELSPILASGKDVLYIGFSGSLSTTFQSACIAADDLRAEFPDATIEVIDSLSASRGQGRLVMDAVKEKNKGKSLAEVAQFVRDEIPHNIHWFTVADLNQLKRGGRISAATALVGTMMNIKPVLRVSEEGKLESVSKSRGIKAALTELVNQMEKSGTAPLADQTVFICHANCPDNVEFVSKLLRERFGVTDIRAEFIGPVIGSHTGMGTLGLFFRGEHR
jgi:DegV family protein with EDD domain